MPRFEAIFYKYSLIRRWRAWLPVAFLLLAGCGSRDPDERQGMSRGTAGRAGGEPPPKTSAPPFTDFANLVPDADTLVHRFMNLLVSGDAAEASKYVVSYQEHKRLYPHLPEADPNPKSAQVIAQLLTQENKKHFYRWLDRAVEESSVFSRYAVAGPVEVKAALEFHSGVRLFVKNAAGKEEEWPVFRTLIRAPGGWKIWSFLDSR